jgi:hypothetical protein
MTLWMVVCDLLYSFSVPLLKSIDGRKIGDSVTGRDLKGNIYDMTGPKFRSINCVIEYPCSLDKLITDNIFLY